jgi:hypothetical protein
VLEMDKDYQRPPAPKRFFLQYSSLGFEELSRACETGHHANHPGFHPQHDAQSPHCTIRCQRSPARTRRDQNLYLSSAERNARIFLEAVEMTAAHSAPVNGLLDQLAVQSALIVHTAGRIQSTVLLLIYYELQAFEQEY